MRGELILPDDDREVDDQEAEKYRVAIHAKTRHVDLWPLAQKYGSVAALAEVLAIHKQTVYDWVNLRTFPNVNYDPEKWAITAESLLVVTGKTFEELWPPALRKAIGGGKASVERTLIMETAHALRTTERLSLPAPAAVYGATDSHVRSDRTAFGSRSGTG